MAVLSRCLCALVNSQFPRRSECTRQYTLARGRQANMRVSHLSPAARNGQENLGCLLHKRRLLLQREHQISVALCLRGERSELPASYTKSRQSCVRVLFHPLQAQCNPAKICCGHLPAPMHQRVSHDHRMAYLPSTRPDLQVGMRCKAGTGIEFRRSCEIRACTWFAFCEIEMRATCGALHEAAEWRRAASPSHRIAAR